MIAYSNNKKLARKYFNKMNWYNCNIGFQNKEIRPLLKEFYNTEDIFISEIDIQNKLWNYAFLTDRADKSQYDILIKLSQELSLPDGLLCFADSGLNFHGFHNRSWTAKKGNIHLSVFLKPKSSIRNFASGFLVLSANSVIQTIDSIGKLNNKASIKWVNDILIDNSKLSGVLAHTHAQSDIIKDAILGIGINVLSKPDINPTLFVPSVTCLNDFIEIKDNRFNRIITNLIDNLANNYEALLNNNYKDLINYYLNRSMIIGKKVSIWSDMKDKNEKIYSGIVENIGENLELYFENKSEPIRSGRLSLD